MPQFKCLYKYDDDQIFFQILSMSKFTFRVSNIKENLSSIIQNVRKKFNNDNSYVTLTLSNNHIEVVPQNSQQAESFSNVFIDMDEYQRQPSYEIRVSTKDILPNVLINQQSSESSDSPIIFQGKSAFNKINPVKFSQNMIVSKVKKKDEEESDKQKSGTKKFQKIQKKSLSSDTDHEIFISDDESQSQSLAIVENKLNQAMSYLKKNKIFELEEFLYNFKAKYMYLNEKVQLKWRILMAHCKQNRKQYERASILYKQVIEMAQASPSLLTLDLADIYHRLGICYSQIRSWNDGILAFTKALNLMKRNEKDIKYAECMNNLGTLYLNAGSISQAQKCFLLSYKIKSCYYPQQSKKLLSCLFNLFECNLLQRNYQQAKQILVQLETLISKIKDNKLLLGGMLRRKGKLYFLKGNLEKARNNYEEAYDRLQEQFQYSLQFGELLNDIGLFKLEEEDLEVAKELFEKSFVILTFYYTKDSIGIQTLKRNIDMVDEILMKKRIASVPPEVKKTLALGQF